MLGKTLKISSIDWKMGRTESNKKVLTFIKYYIISGIISFSSDVSGGKEKEHWPELG